jgi:16S rRNA (uracil1498-N3)-methyltransferase
VNLFYSKDITPEGFCTLDPEESRHAVRVLRLREGDTIHVTDGRGNLYRCEILQASDKACTLQTFSPLTSHLSPFSFHLAVAPTKNPSRMEWLVEKAVELGVGEITLLNCDHSERSFLKTDRLEKLAVSAMKQSLHTLLPAIHPAVPLREFLQNVDKLISLYVDRGAGNVSTNQPNNGLTYQPINVSTQKFIAHCEADKPRVPLATAMQPGRDAVILIGPEGDFSQEEIALALDSGFQPVSLGSHRLRTETAALYAVTAFNYINDR